MLTFEKLKLKPVQTFPQLHHHHYHRGGSFWLFPKVASEGDRFELRFDVEECSFPERNLPVPL